MDSGLGVDETDPLRFQTFRTSPLANALTLDDVLVDVWAAMLNFDTGKIGAVSVFLRDRDPSGPGYIELGNGTVYARDWQDGAGSFVERMAHIPNVNSTIPSSHELEVRVVVDDISGDKMMLAYDTLGLPLLIKPSYLAPPADTTIYFRNNPTPPTTSTNSQAVLPMSTSTPTTTIALPNYDLDRDALEGLLLNPNPPKDVLGDSP